MSIRNSITVQHTPLIFAAIPMYVHVCALYNESFILQPG